MVDINAVQDLANKAYAEFARYQVPFTLVPKSLTTDAYVIKSLNWDSVKYGEEEKHKVPNNKRGIYAFCIHCPSPVLPCHGYVLYIGIAGDNSERSLRERYQDYLRTSYIQGRPNITRIISDWHEVLRFFYAPVDDDVSAYDLQLMEQQLNTALAPPFSIRDISAEIKQARNAFP